MFKEMQLHKKAIKHEINSVICLQATGQSIVICMNVCMYVGLPFQVLFLWVFGYIKSYTRPETSALCIFSVSIPSIVLLLRHFRQWNVHVKRFLVLWHFICFYDVAARLLYAPHNCQGLAIKIIIKNNGNKPNLMCVCVPVHISVLFFFENIDQILLQSSGWMSKRGQDEMKHCIIVKYYTIDL